MFYRLGHFRPQLGSHDYEGLLDHAEASLAMLDVLEEMLDARLSRTELREGEPTRNSPNAAIPDLLSALPPDSPDRPWVTEIHGELVKLERKLSIRLLACEYEPGDDGFLCIAGTSPSVEAEVRRFDRVQAGFVALRQGTDPLRLSTRVFRLVCYNGSIVSVAESEQASADTTPVAAALSRCFDPTAFAEVVRSLAACAQAPLDMELYGDEWNRLGARHGVDKVMKWLGEARSRLQREVPRNDAATRWDLVNALTEVARDLPDWRERFDLEEAAGRLALLHRPVPRRATGNEAPVPV